MGEGILEKVKYLIGIEEEYDEDEYEAPKDTKKYEKEMVSRPSSTTGNYKENKVVNFQNKNQMKLVLHEPCEFDECSKVVDNLKSKKPVIVNLEKVDTDVARRIFDFVSGATYALDGTVQKVANNIFVFAPDTVDIASNTQEASFTGNAAKSIFK